MYCLCMWGSLRLPLVSFPEIKNGERVWELDLPIRVSALEFVRNQLMPKIAFLRHTFLP